MKTAQQLYEKYQSDLERLQSECKHLEQSDWLNEEWAPAHGTGFQVKVCSFCNKTIDRRGGYPLNN